MPAKKRDGRSQHELEELDGTRGLDGMLHARRHHEHLARSKRHRRASVIGKRDARRPSSR